MEKWKYKSLNITFKNNSKENELVQTLGKEGWEMVGFQARRILFIMPVMTYIFKRKLSE